MNGVIALPVKKLRARAAFQKARSVYPNGVGVIFQLKGERWLLALQSPLSSTFLTWLKTSQTAHRAYVENQGGAIFCLVIREEQLCFAYLGEPEHAQILLEATCRSELPSLAIHSQLNAEHTFNRCIQTSCKRGFANVEACPTGKHRGRYSRLSRLQHARPIAISFGLIALLLAGWQQWPAPAEVAVVAIPPEQKVIDLLERAPGRITPLLRLDYNLQSALNQLSGWQLNQVRYTANGIEYEIDREGGNLRQLRALTKSLNLELSANKDQWRAFQRIQLPPPMENTEAVSWHSVEALSDWLDYQLALWLPGAQLLSVPDQSHGKFEQQRLAVLLKDHYLPDLLTLAAILEGLPVSIQGAELKRNGEQVSGHIELLGVGVKEHG